MDTWLNKVSERETNTYKCLFIESMEHKHAMPIKCMWNTAKDGNSLELLFCLGISSTYEFHLHLCCNKLISIHVLEEENSATDFVDMGITFIFILQKDESVMVKSKLHSRQKQLHLFASFCTDT